MPAVRHLSAVLFALAIALPATAAEMAAPHRGTCLTKAEQRAAVAAHKAVPLAQAMRALHGGKRRPEVVRARLCRHGEGLVEGLVYVLTLLAPSGKVMRVNIDAANGELITGR